MLGSDPDDGGAGADAAAGWSARAAARAEVDRARALAEAYARSLARGEGFAAAAMSEPMTAAALHPLRQAGWCILHDRQWPQSSRANVDHLAIGPTGVAVLDSKHWSEPIQIRDGRLWCGDDDRQEAVEDLLRLVDMVDALVTEVQGSSPGVAVGLSPVHVLPVLVFTKQPPSPARVPRLGRVQLATLRTVARVISRRAVVLSPQQVALVGEYLAREMPPAVTSAQVPSPRPSVVAAPIRPGPTPPPEPEPRVGEAFDELFAVADLRAELARAAAQPLEDWRGFLHPSQVRLVRRCYHGPARVRGPAGTGKTVVLLHRAAWLATVRTGRILVTSLVRTFLHQHRPVFARLSPDTAERVDFLGVHELAGRLLAEADQSLPINSTRVETAFARAWSRVGSRSILARICPSPQYWRDEIDHVIKGRGLGSFVEYEHLERRGRGIPLTGQDKAAVWDLLVAYSEQLTRAGTNDFNDLLSAAVDLVEQAPPQPGWSAVLVDEVQDLPLLAMKLCTQLGGVGTDGLFIVGDGQQALYPGGFTLGEAAVSVQGRATVLRVNYRNTREILDAARELVEQYEFFDLDPTSERGARDVEVLRSGPCPRQVEAATRDELAGRLCTAIAEDRARGVAYGEMAVLTHSRADAAFLRRYLFERQLPVRDLAHWAGTPDDKIKIDTVHRAKGLDFAAVYLPAFDRPAQHTATPERAERDIRRARGAFVGRTRARDRLWLGSVR